MIEDSELSRKAAAEFDEWDNVVRYCAHCDEEYQLPENMEKCVICGNNLTEEE